MWKMASSERHQCCDISRDDVRRLSEWRQRFLSRRFRWTSHAWKERPLASDRYAQYWNMVLCLVLKFYRVSNRCGFGWLLMCLSWPAWYISSCPLYRGLDFLCCWPDGEHLIRHLVFLPICICIHSFHSIVYSGYYGWFAWNPWTKYLKMSSVRHSGLSLMLGCMF